MSDVNYVFLIGRLTRDAQLKSTANGKSVVKFSIAVNKKRKVGDGYKDTAGFFDVVVWDRLGESLNPYLTKGKQIAVVGELTQERWCGDDGQNHSKVTVTASTIQLLGGNSNSGSGSAENHNPSLADAASDDGYVDDIPF